MSFQIPLAKKSTEKITGLDEHLKDVATYLKELLDAYRLFLEQLIPNYDGFINGVIQAALVHDLGKAAEGFQKFLQKNIPWEFRHEVLSLALVLSKDVIGSSDFYGFAAVLTHHKNIDDELLLRATGAKRASIFIRKIEEKQKNIARELHPYQEWLKDYLKKISLWYREPDFRAVRKFHENLLNESENTSILQPKGFKLAVARGALMAADHAVSFGVKHFLKMLHKPNFAKKPRKFQMRAGECESSLILEAPTGAGKTEAALRWALMNRKAGERLFYVLPTRASIHAMYHSLRKYFGSKHVGFIHAKALNYLFEYYDNENYEETYYKARQEKDLNLLFYKPIKVLTPYQIIKWFFGLKRFEIGFLELLGGVFIFDEIHAYDPHTTALILETMALLSRFRGRFFLMSATIPDFLLHEIKGLSSEEINCLKLDECDPTEQILLKQPRHKLIFEDCYLEDLLDKIASLAQTKKVLVVANRVEQAQKIYLRLRNDFGFAGEKEIFLLHNRFTYEDRNKKEQRIIEILQGKDLAPLKILVATQVIEVSLDISFDIMFTEIAPVDDLLQRMGRVNRYGEAENPAGIYIAMMYDKTKNPYDPFYLEKTLDNRPENGTLLSAEEASFWLKEAYRTGFSEKDRQKFETARTNFRRIIEDLRPLRGSHEEEYFSLFETYEILPISKFKFFKERLEKKEIIKAFALMVPVYRGLWHKLKKEQLLESLEDKAILAQIKYDSELGLLDEPDFFDNFL